MEKFVDMLCIMYIDVSDVDMVDAISKWYSIKPVSEHLDTTFTSTLQKLEKKYPIFLSIRWELKITGVKSSVHISSNVYQNPSNIPNILSVHWRPICVISRNFSHFNEFLMRRFRFSNLTKLVTHFLFCFKIYFF